jgi:hypothetical protein
VQSLLLLRLLVCFGRSIVWDDGPNDRLGNVDGSKQYRIVPISHSHKHTELIKKELICILVLLSARLCTSQSQKVK